MIRATDLHKRFGSQPVLRALSFEIPKGALCGFIGPNGAGKTTTMRILATLDEPTSGSMFVDGLDVMRDAARVRRLLGYMPDYYGVYSDLICSEYLEFFARSLKFQGGLRAPRVQDVIEFTEIGGLLTRPVEALSKGQKQRLSLARALLPDPEVLVLDEPAAGLDPRARIELRELLKLLTARGKTVFISSHILSELADQIDWLVIIDHGVIRHCGRPEAVAASLETAGITTYLLELTSDAASARRFLLEQAAVRGVEGEGGTCVLQLDESHEKVEDLIARLVQHGGRFRELYRRQPDLEEVFLRATSRRSDAPNP
jgi:ABC-2 type transport system ATP-binding protein